MEEKDKEESKESNEKKTKKGKERTCKGNWDHPDCRYDDSPGKDGRCQVVGIYTDSRSYFSFSLHEQTSGEYTMRGTVSLRSARDHNRVLKSKGDDGKEKPVSVPIRVRSCEEGAIKAKIVQVCTKLASENYGAIYRNLKDARMEDMTLATAIDLYGRDYMVTGTKVDPANYNARIQEMMRIAVRLEQYMIPQIPVSALEQIKKETEAASDKSFAQIWKFLDWLGRKNYYRGRNPFTEYYRNHPKKTPKSAADAAKDQFQPRSLTDDLAVKLRRKIADAPAAEEKATGLLLVYQAGLDAKTACAAHWGDLEFDGVRHFESSCVIKLDKKNGGATQDFTHPIFPWAVNELRRRYQELKADDPKLDEKKILANTTPDQLTAYCRTELSRLGVSYADLSAAREDGNMGGGVRLLLEDYSNTLIHHCGIRSEATVRFLQGKTLKNDVTTDNYSSSSCPMGQERIQHYMERDTRFVAKPRKAPIIVREEDGKKTVIIPPNDPQRYTMIVIKVRMKKGEQIKLYSRQGLKVTAKKA